MRPYSRLGRSEGGSKTIVDLENGNYPHYWNLKYFCRYGTNRQKKYIYPIGSRKTERNNKTDRK